MCIFPYFPFMWNGAVWLRWNMLSLELLFTLSTSRNCHRKFFFISWFGSISSDKVMQLPNSWPFLVEPMATIFALWLFQEILFCALLPFPYLHISRLALLYQKGTVFLCTRKKTWMQNLDVNWHSPLINCVVWSFNFSRPQFPLCIIGNIIPVFRVILRVKLR